jgi:hypothetical protein
MIDDTPAPVCVATHVLEPIIEETPVVLLIVAVREPTMATLPVGLVAELPSDAITADVPAPAVVAELPLDAAMSEVQLSDGLLVQVLEASTLE